MDIPKRRIAIMARQLYPEATANRVNRFTVKDNVTGKSYEIAAPDGRFTLDVQQKLPVDTRSGGKSYVPGARSHITQYRVQFIGAPFALGQNLRGAELAPMAVRGAGLKTMVERLGWEYADNGDLKVDSVTTSADSGIGGEAWKAKMWEKYQKWVRSGTNQSYVRWSGETIRTKEDPIEVKGDPYDYVTNCAAIGQACGAVHKEVYEAANRGDFALTVGGDHSIASATIGGLVKAYPNLCVIWVDAHADANTPDTSPSLHYHGMPAAHVMGWFNKPLKGFEWLKSVLPEARLAYIGLRDVDPEESRMLCESGCHIYTMQDVDRYGISKVVSMARSKVDPYDNRPIHLTLDIDGLDPIAAPGTGTLARGGLSYREAHFICEELASTNRLVGCDLVEVNPLVDILPVEQMHGDDPDLGPCSCTVSLCCELALSVLGRTILLRRKMQEVTV